MEFKELIAISGQPGLHKVIAKSKNGFIVEAIADAKRQAVSANQRISTLNDISVYTTDEEMPLKKVMAALEAKADKFKEVDAKADAEKMQQFFEAAVPNYDKEKVYASDIKKMMTWFRLLEGKVDFNKEESDEPALIEEVEKETKQPTKIHEVHGPKAEGAKSSKSRTRKKV